MIFIRKIQQMLNLQDSIRTIGPRNSFFATGPLPNIIIE